MPTAKFQKDGFWIDNPTVMGALQETGIPYSISTTYGATYWTDDIAGIPGVLYYVDGVSPWDTLNKYPLSGGEWITVNAPYTVSPLFLEAPDDAVVGKFFFIKVMGGVFAERFHLDGKSFMVPRESLQILDDHLDDVVLVDALQRHFVGLRLLF